jgi:hypothetical protein
LSCLRIRRKRERRIEMLNLCTAEEVAFHNWRDSEEAPPYGNVPERARLLDCPEHDGLPNHEGPEQSPEA